MNFEQFSPFSIQVILMFVVILLKTVFNFKRENDLMYYFRFYCQKLAEKVNKPTNNKNQQKLAGAIATIITVSPIVIILWLFADFVEVPLLWYGFLLFFAIDGGDLFHKSKSTAQRLKNNNNYQVKAMLSSVTLRDTEKLSSLGLVKAFIEVQLLKTNQQLIAVCFYFLVFGPLAAITYRLLLEMHYSWNTKLASYQNFGRFSHTLHQLLIWLPTRLFYFMQSMLNINRHSLLFWRLNTAHLFKLSQSILMNNTALHTGTKLGGVAMYNGEKIRKEEFNSKGQQPSIIDLLKISKHIQKILFALSIIVIIIAILSNLST